MSLKWRTYFVFPTPLPGRYDRVFRCDLLLREAGTVFAYGATGAGKTYTMSGREQVLGPGRGPGGRLRPGNRGKLPPGGVGDGTEGLVPRSMRFLFQQISALPSTVTMRIRASFYEIYNEVVYDLLTQRARRPLQVSLLLLPGAPHPTKHGRDTERTRTLSSLFRSCHPCSSVRQVAA